MNRGVDVPFLSFTNICNTFRKPQKKVHGMGGMYKGLAIKKKSLFLKLYEKKSRKNTPKNVVTKLEGGGP